MTDRLALRPAQTDWETEMWAEALATYLVDGDLPAPVLIPERTTRRGVTSMTDTLEELIRQAAGELDEIIRDGYREGCESELADDVIARLDDRDKALRELMDDHVGAMIAGLCLLDECDNRTYDVQHRLALELYAAVVIQQNQDTALRELLAVAIESERALLFTQSPLP